jgi:Transposase DDE domain
MNRTEAIAWVVSLCASYLRLSQAKTLSQLVAAAMHCQRISMPAIGRAMSGKVKAQIKRCWRFCNNQRVEVSDAMRPVVQKLLKKRNRKKKLLISFDWTDIRGFQTLMCSAVIKGRSIPLLWASCTKHVYDGHRSRNAFEESLLLVLRSMIPRQVKIILLADRGFGRTELGRFCQQWKLHYIIRIKPEVVIKSTGYSGKLLDYPVHKGICKLLKSVEYRSTDPLQQNIVVRWVRNLPKHRDECWFLMTDLSMGPAAISQLYRKRMTIEELFRDQKNKLNGWALRTTKIQRADRLDRMILILALAYLLLCGIGLIALETCRPGAWSSSSKNDCSVFTIGRVMLTRLQLSVSQVFQAVVTASEEVVQKWG